MSALHDLQADVLRALLGRTNRAASRVAAHGLDPQRRLDIYRNNLFESLSDALEAVYPTVARLVGRGFFRYAAREYIPAHPPASGNLHDFGGGLPAFLASFAPAASLPYLCDVARLEWAWHEVFHADAAPALDAADALRRVALLPMHERARLRLRVQPAARLLSSRFPVFRIWRANLEDEPPALSLDDGAEHVLVAQRGGDVVVEPLGAAEHALLDALGARETLGTSIAAAFEIDADFDAAAAIARHFGAGTLVGLRSDGQPGVD